MLKKLLTYIGVGFLFGVVDWFVQEGVGQLGRLGFVPDTLLIVPVIFLLIYGVWLIPAYFVARDAAQVSRLFAAIATCVTWSVAVIVYYLTYAAGLLFVGLPNMDHLLWRNRHTAAFAGEWTYQANRLLIDQVIDWLPFAIVSGLLVGYVIARISAEKRPSRYQVSPSNRAIT